MAAGCSGMPSMCRHTVASQGATLPTALGDDTLSFDMPGNGNGVNVVVEGNSRNVQINAMIFNNATGEITALLSAGEVDTW